MPDATCATILMHSDALSTASQALQSISMRLRSPNTASSVTMNHGSCFVEIPTNVNTAEEGCKGVNIQRDQNYKNKDVKKKG